MSVNQRIKRGFNKIAYSRNFTPESYGEMVDSLNTILTTLLLSQNMDGQVIEDIFLPAGQDVKVSHNLKTTPKYRIILRNTGGGLIDDTVNQWNDKFIYLKASADSTISVLLMRG